VLLSNRKIHLVFKEGFPMAINGTYNVTIQTPMGAQSGTVTFRTEGNVLNGDAQVAGGGGKFTGTVDGENGKWASEVPNPMGGMLTLTFNVKVTATDLNGTVVLGPFGTSTITGKKV
jgi:quinohemoprotein ethanol dehydrogenase